MSERILPPYEVSNDPEEYIKLLDPRLATMLASASEKERRLFYRKFRDYHEIAFWMVRYAVDEEIGSYSLESQIERINPNTGKHFTFEDLGIERTSLIGSTAGSFIHTEPQRFQYVSLVALSLYHIVEDITAES